MEGSSTGYIVQGNGSDVVKKMKDENKKKSRKKDEVKIHFENGEGGLVGTIHGLAKAFNPPKKGRDPRTEEKG